LQGLALVILMLGTNDFQLAHPNYNAWASAQGFAAVVAEIRKAPIEPGIERPRDLSVDEVFRPETRGCRG
jgi:hypothetical protein